MIVVQGSLEVHEQATSMLNHGDYPILDEHDHMVDHLYRTEEDRIKNFAVGTMALLVCKIGVGTKKRIIDAYEIDETIVDLY